MNLKTIGDKALHVLAGALVSGGFMAMGGDDGLGVFAAIVAGAGKEFVDWLGERGTVDPADFVCTVLGGAAVEAAWGVLTA